ncbi:hypothetical protein [Oricola indica]|uniref:hypothetical protein n=1 Tax=Oricola indica TaxID=2872591 RepID=UPI001CC1A822|nr:hypothetical protein [Oricola indica]
MSQTGEVWRSGIELIIRIWKLLRGNAAHRFSATLVRAGATLVAGSPAIYLLLQLAFDSIFGNCSAETARVDDYLAIGGFVVGVLLIGAGIYIFYQFRVVIAFEDQLAFIVQPGAGFQETARFLADDYFLKFEGFSPAELAAPLSERKVIVPDVIFALQGLGTLARTGNFPNYRVREENGTIIVRKTDV